MFIGDVGIPDVAQRYDNMSKEELIANFTILKENHEIPDEVIIYPYMVKELNVKKFF